MPQAAQRLDAYPHQLSGGQRQRVMIAAALACGPDLLVADEPTTALDATLQRAILGLIGELVAEHVARVQVMYGGTVVECGLTADVFARLAHPYTRGLFDARPRLGATRGQPLATIAGRVPELVDPPQGCPFADRCGWVVDACRAALPAMFDVGHAHEARCIRVADVLASTRGVTP